MVVLLLLLFYYLFIEITSIKISAEELAKHYSSEMKEADDKFLNKEIELNGRVKTYFDFDNDSDLLELNSENAKISVFCMLLNDDQINKAKSLTQGTEVTIKGRCLGMTDYKFQHSVYIRVSEIK
jgi:hypothetical protein